MKPFNILTIALAGLALAACQSTVTEAEPEKPETQVSADFARAHLAFCLQTRVQGNQVVRTFGPRGRVSILAFTNQLLDRCEDQFDQLEDALIAEGMTPSGARRTVADIREDLYNEILEGIRSGESTITESR
jgi:hypothetical protein